MNENGWKSVDRTIESTGYIAEEVDRNTSRFSWRLYWASFGWYMFGVMTGATGTAWQYESQPKPAPVVVEIEKSVPADLEPLKTSLEQHLMRLEAHQATMQQALVKLSTINRAQAAQLIEREPIVRVGQDGVGTDHRGNGERAVFAAQGTHQQSSDAAPLSIQQKAKELWLRRMVVK